MTSIAGPDEFIGPCNIKFSKPKDPTRMRRIPYTRTRKSPAVRIVVDIQLRGKLDLELWKKLKLPKPWRKCPRQSWKNDINFPVRIYAYEPADLSAEQLSFIQAHLGLLVK